MVNNMLEAYPFFAFYDSVDRSFTPEDLQSMIKHILFPTVKKKNSFMYGQ